MTWEVTYARQKRAVGGKRGGRVPYGDDAEEAGVIEQEVLQRVLGAALRSGGEFAEIYAEDKRSTSARFDDGKVEELSSGRADVERLSSA